jgi:hypothetical protein
LPTVRGLAAAILDAREAGKVRIRRTIERTSAHDWKAAAWLLERTFPDEFGRIDRIRAGGDSTPVRIIHEERDPDFISDVMNIYRESGVLLPEQSSGPAARTDPERSGTHRTAAATFRRPRSIRTLGEGWRLPCGAAQLAWGGRTWTHGRLVAWKPMLGAFSG